MAKSDKFRFKRLDNIGAAAAEEDHFYLERCFVDTGDIEALRDCQNPCRLLLGRTGSGKSAVLIHFAETEDRCIEIKPESLALSYISNSTILQFFTELGVKLDIFFRLLWRHVFTVEILKHHFKIDDEASRNSFIDKIINRFRDKKHTKAVEYLRKWGASFWEETEYRIKELTTTLENDLKAAVASKMPPVRLSAESANKLTEEQRQEVINRAQHVVNNVQIRELSDILELVNDVLDDQQKRYFILIDRLDENWVEDVLRFRLIRALIETVKDFGKVRQVKIVVALRIDLLERVFRLTRDAGFQEEKYHSLYLPIQWSKKQLLDVLDTRVSALIEQRYTKEKVTHRDIMPTAVDGIPATDYMLQRTMMRPRDVILFFNCCIALATDRPQITAQIIRDAEASYSAGRLQSLADEWSADYPSLLYFTGILRSKPRHFRLGDVFDALVEMCLEYAVRPRSPCGDVIAAAAIQVAEMEMVVEEFSRVLFKTFYRVGLVGLKLETFEPLTFCAAKNVPLDPAVIGEDTRAGVHPMFWRALGIRPDSFATSSRQKKRR